MKPIFIQQILSGSSFVSPALSGEGINNNFPPKKIRAKAKSRRAKRKGSLGEMNFTRLPCRLG